MASEVAPVAGHERNARPWTLHDHKGITPPRHAWHRREFSGPVTKAPQALLPAPPVKHPHLKQAPLGHCEGPLRTQRNVNDEPERIIPVCAAQRVDSEQAFRGIDGTRQRPPRRIVATTPERGRRNRRDNPPPGPGSHAHPLVYTNVTDGILPPRIHRHRHAHLDAVTDYRESPLGPGGPTRSSPSIRYQSMARLAMPSRPGRRSTNAAMVDPRRSYPIRRSRIRTVPT